MRDLDRGVPMEAASVVVDDAHDDSPGLAARLRGHIEDD
jgi:hypothetical protein